MQAVENGKFHGCIEACLETGFYPISYDCSVEYALVRVLVVKSEGCRMKTLDVLRHTMRRKSGAHLSQDGITLARLVGDAAAAYDRVFSSPLPRAIETALFMGFEVHEIIDGLSGISEETTRGIAWPNSYSGVMQIIKSGGACAEYAYKQAALWKEIAEKLSDGEHGLIITHGGVVALGAVASAPLLNHAEWGDAAGYCEGVRLHYEGNAVVNVTIIRVPEEYRLIHN